MKKGLIICSLILMAASAYSQKVIDRIICQVGGEIVLQSDVDKSIAFLKDSYGQVDDETECYVLQDLLAQKLLVNQAKLDSVEVTRDEIDLQLDARLNQILAAMNFDEARFEEYYGKTVADVRREQRENIESKLLTERMRGKIMANVQATPSEVVEFFNSIPKDSLPYFNSEVEISEVVYKIPYSTAEENRAKETLESVRQKVLNGEETFKDMALKYSDDPGSRANGGDLGWAKRGTYVTEFEATLYSLEVDEYSEIVETQFGYHFMQLTGRLGENIQARHILIKPELTANDILLAEVKLDSVCTLISADSMTFERAVEAFGDENEQSYSNGGRIVNPQTGNTFFEISDLDSDVYFAIVDLEVGEVSEPILIERPGQDPIYKVYKLVSRTPPHRASLETDYARIQQYASETKRSEKFQNWLLDRIDNTFIQVDKAFYGCPNIDLWVDIEAN